MPYAAKKPCTRCGKLGQCEEHKSRRYDKTDTNIPIQHSAKPREKTAARGYGSKWQSARKGYLRRHPLCALCEAEGRVVEATVVDHIIPHRGDKTLFWDHENWRAICKPHHDRKTAAEDSYRGVDGKWGSGKV
ncbi:MAG: HNH endonuclease [Acidobacteriota bacterium]|nr:HNH endonuclease [Acidobacteriota bacterium]